MIRTRTRFYAHHYGFRPVRVWKLMGLTVWRRAA